MQSLAESFELILYREFFAGQGIYPYMKELAIQKDMKSAVEIKDLRFGQVSRGIHNHSLQFKVVYQ